MSVIEVLPILAYFVPKTCSSVLGYNAIKFKVCQKVDVTRRKRIKTVYYRISCSYVNLKATGSRVFEMPERANQRIGQEYCFCGVY